MSKGKLKTAVLGLTGRGELLLEALKGVDYFEIQAVADKDTSLAEKIAGQCQCAAYDDYRQLIIQNQLDCLLVAAGIHSCDEYVRMAMKKKFNIFKLAPAARDFEEAVEFVRLGEEQDIKFAIGNPRRFARSFLALRDFLQQGRIEHAFLMTAFCIVGDGSYPGWQTDPKLAGGGVLLHNGYWVIDQMVNNFGLPQQVYSLGTNNAQDKQQRLYLTEDTSVVTMKFSDVFTGNLVASRRPGTGPKEEYIKLYGKDTILTVSDKKVTLCDGLGQAIEVLKYADDEYFCMREQLKNFAMSILSPDTNKLCSSGGENLQDMAVIESAYLSARTGFPEEPAKVLQMAPGLTGEMLFEMPINN
ncbi:MAG: Gfo/Idh/MocA family oxidoreductase [Planctomycetes bacterium]|nr:Gfo/Idh/MocA family oxidoreductase [Planctomycetota bacterium]MBL7144623.1 Gfo/Idh/MocA family oxidoreductase [Phycisphaerae bacterium]